MPGTDVTESTGTIRIRQRDPGDFEEKSFRTKDLTAGVKAVFGRLKGETTMTLQTYLFDPDKFSKDEAEAWVAKHSKKSASDRFVVVTAAPALFDEGKLARGEVVRAGSWIYGGETMDITPEMLAKGLENW